MCISRSQKRVTQSSSVRRAHPGLLRQLRNVRKQGRRTPSIPLEDAEGPQLSRGLGQPIHMQKPCQEENSTPLVPRGNSNYPCFLFPFILQPQLSAMLVHVCRIAAQHPWMPPAAAPALISNEAALTKGVALTSSRGICS